jgi:RNA polymerase sigma factor (sigma-70 family)
MAVSLASAQPDAGFACLAAGLLAEGGEAAIDRTMPGERAVVPESRAPAPETRSEAGLGELERLIQRVASERDRAAFAGLYRHFAPRVKSYVMRLGADPASAEEIAQEAMLTLWRRADRFDPAQASASTWVFTIARNKRIDGLRRTKRPELDPEDPALVPAAPSPADALIEAEERSRRLSAAIELLPSEQASLLQLAYYDDLSHSAIARTTELPLGTVKSRLRLAFARLRQALAEEA